MPKEVIHDDTLLADGENSTRFAVEVGWSRDAYVQLGSVNLQAEPATVERGWFVDLNRPMINKVIRALRRARDQAFGADE